MAAVTAVIGLMLTGGAALAQSAASDPGARDMVAADGFPLPLNLPPPVETGKSRFFVTPPVTPPLSGCVVSFDCRVRVIGAIERNGAVEINATALKW
jgi:hypothetical protein